MTHREQKYCTHNPRANQQPTYVGELAIMWQHFGDEGHCGAEASADHGTQDCTQSRGSHRHLVRWTVEFWANSWLVSRYCKK